RLAHPPARPDHLRHRGRRALPARGRPPRGHPSRRPRLLRARREPLARRRAQPLHGPHRHAAERRDRQPGDLGPPGHGRGVRRRCVPSVGLTVNVRPPRRTVSARRSPGSRSAIAATRSLLPVTFWPSTAVTTSPARSPADDAGLPALTAAISAPAVVVDSPELTPRKACSMVRPASSARSWRVTRSIGTAKPTPELCSLEPPPVAIWSAMPTTWPLESRIGPPEL